jgi:hypothetical protein
MFGGVELRSSVDQVIAQIGRVEQRNGLSRLDGIADAHPPFGDLASNPERKRRGIPRLYLSRQRGVRRAPVGMNRDSDDGFRLGGNGFARVAGRQQQCAASRTHKTSSKG